MTTTSTLKNASGGMGGTTPSASRRRGGSEDVRPKRQWINSSMVDRRLHGNTIAAWHRLLPYRRKDHAHLAPGGGCPSKGTAHPTPKDVYKLLGVSGPTPEDVYKLLGVQGPTPKDVYTLLGHSGGNLGVLWGARWP
eukprot:scaffold23884_cov30-Phaeocystis_antarctica.AAC.1